MRNSGITVKPSEAPVFHLSIKFIFVIPGIALYEAFEGGDVVARPTKTTQ